MTLNEIFELMSAGALSQISIGGQDTGVINDTNAPKLIPHINLALTTLYTRFALKEGRLLLEPVADQSLYLISSRFAVHNAKSKELVRYLIDDAAEPFADDIIKIERVLTDGGVDLPLNNELLKYAAFTPTATALRLPLEVVNQVRDLPDELKTEHLELVYRANHPRLASDADTERDLVQLPFTHLDALVNFVASCVHMPTGMNVQTNMGDPFMVKFEAACQALEGKGVQVDNSAGFDKLRDRGFV